MFEPRDPGFAACPPRTTSAKPTLLLIQDPLGQSVARPRNHRLQDAHLDDALLTATRVEASVGGGETWRSPKELDVTLDGGHEKQCVGASFDGHVGDDPAIGLLHLYARPEFGRGRIDDRHRIERPLDAHDDRVRPGHGQVVLVVEGWSAMFDAHHVRLHAGDEAGPRSAAYRGECPTVPSGAASPSTSRTTSTLGGIGSAWRTSYFVLTTDSAPAYLTT
jgi:hypothetical protein